MSNSTIQKKNAFYAQSGGVTAVINATACGLIEAAREHADKIGNVYPYLGNCYFIIKSVLYCFKSFFFLIF